MKLKNHTSRQPLPSLQGGARGWVFVFFALLLTSCTLSMEDWAVPEEQKGFDEAETVENEFGTMTYQFKDGVRSITENIQEYIVEVEDDSIIYFMDNTPSEWLPRVGDKVAAMCSPVIPFGLNHKVIDVRDVGGIYKVTCTKATRSEIYEKLVIDLDYEVATPDVPMYDSLYLDSLGIKGEDLVIEDLSLLEDYYGTESMAKANKPRRAYKKNASWKRTRAALELPNEILATRGEKSSDSVMHWHLAKLTFTERTTGLKFALDGELEKHSVQRIVYKEDKEKDYKKQVTTDKSYDIWKASATLTKGKDVFDAHDDQTAKSLKELKQALKNLAPSKPAGKKTMVGGKILCPIPAMPAISLAINLEGNVSFEGAICIDATIKHYHPQTESAYEYKDGEEIYHPTKTIKEGYVTVDDYKAYGSLTLSAQVRAGVGVEITGTGIGGDIGVGITAKLTAKSPFLDVQQLIDDETMTLVDDNPHITVESYFFVDASIYFSPGGFEVFKAAHTLVQKNLFKETLYPLPKVDKKKTSFTYKIMDEDENLTRNNRYTILTEFSNLWVLGLPSERCYPRLRMYVGGYEGECTSLPEDDRKGNERNVEKGTSYQYTRYFETGKYDKIICVPSIYDAVHHHYYEFRESAMTFGTAKPSFTYVKQKSRVSLSINKYFEKEGLDDEDVQKDFLKEYGLDKLPAWMKNLNNWYFHEHALALDIKNLGMVDHWGVKVRIETSSDTNNGTKLIESEINISKRNTYMKAGKKTLVFSFVTNWSKGHEIKITPYTVDSQGNKTYYEKTFGPYTISEDTYRSTWNWNEWPGAMIQADVFAN